MKKIIKEWGSSILILSAILILGFFLRFYNLTNLPVFADEAIYIRWSQVMKAEETLRFLPLSDGKQPLFMWMVIPALKVFSDPLMAGRMVSVMSGIGTLIGICVLSYLLLKSRKAAFVAGLIYTVSPFAIFFNRMALADSMLSMFGIWTFIFAYLSFTRVRLDYAMLAGFSLGGAWLTKSPALFFALLLPTLWIFAKRKDFLKTLSLTAVTVGIGYGFYNILRLGPNFHQIASRNLDYVYPLSHFLTSPIDPLKPFLLQAWQWIGMMGPWALIVLTACAILLNVRNNFWQAAVLLVWFLGPIVVQSEFAKVFTARYIFFSIPYLMIVISSVFVEAKENFSKILWVFLGLFALQSLFFDYKLIVSPEKANLPRSERSGYLEEWTAGHGIKEISDDIKEEIKKNPDRQIIVGTEGYFGTLPDGIQIYLNNIPNIVVVGVGLDFTKLPQSLIDSHKSGNKTYLIVNDERFHGNYEEQGLKLVKSYPKALRPDGTYQSLLFFELTDETLKLKNTSK